MHLLDTDESLPADLAVMAVGIRPKTRLSTDAGLDVARGILVDAQMQTSDPEIFAVGECVGFDGNLFGLVAPPLYDQVSGRLCGQGYSHQAEGDRLRSV